MLALLAATSSMATKTCPAAQPPPSLLVPAHCPTPPNYTGTLLRDLTAQPQPIVVTPGCPIDFSVAEMEHIFLKINRPAGTILRTRFRYDDVPVPLLRAWAGMPTTGDTTYFEDVVYPRSNFGSEIAEVHADGHDLYHYGINGVASNFPSLCGAELGYSPCNAPPLASSSPDEQVGDLFMTIVGISLPPESRATGRLSFELLAEPTNATQIPTAQLNALKELHASTCATRPPPVFDASANDLINDRWRRSNHEEGVYSLKTPNPQFLHPDIYASSGLERAFDKIPFCDWLADEDVASLTFCAGLADHGVTCDANGNVIRLNLKGYGLQGPLPASFATAFPYLEGLDLSFNQLSGPLPRELMGAGAVGHNLEEVNVGHNQFAGSIPCPPVGSNIRLLTLEYNDFDGDLPGCLFSNTPVLSRAKLGGLVHLTPAPLPASVQHAAHMTELDVSLSRLNGELPANELACASNMAVLNLAHNELTGGLKQAILDGMPALEHLDASFNRLSGKLPTVVQPRLAHVNVRNNDFSGDLTEQLEALAAHVKWQDGFTSLQLSNNRFSGALPRSLEALLRGAHLVRNVGVGGNHFRCAANTAAWPDWAAQISAAEQQPEHGWRTEFPTRSILGKCERVPLVTSVENAVVGGLMSVRGEHFKASDELTCRLHNGAGDREVRASFVTETLVTCTLPNDLEFTPTHEVELSVANFGTDYSSALSVPIESIASEGDALPAWAVHVVAVGSAIGGSIILGLLAFVVILVSRERKGRPVFRALVSDLPVTTVQMAPPASVSGDTTPNSCAQKAKAVIIHEEPGKQITSTKAEATAVVVLAQHAEASGHVEPDHEVGRTERTDSGASSLVSEQV